MQELSLPNVFPVRQIMHLKGQFTQNISYNPTYPSGYQAIHQGALWFPSLDYFYRLVHFAHCIFAHLHNCTITKSLFLCMLCDFTVFIYCAGVLCVLCLTLAQN